MELASFRNGCRFVALEYTPIGGKSSKAIRLARARAVPEFEPLELVRTIAAARIVMPESTIRLSAGRSSMSEETHALCLHAGASSIFLGDRLLTADNNGDDADAAILDQLDVSVRPLDQPVSIEP